MKPSDRLHKINGYDAAMAVLQASTKVRNGDIFNGAPTHVVAELLSELERMGFWLGVPDLNPLVKRAKEPDGSALPSIDALT